MKPTKSHSIHPFLQGAFGPFSGEVLRLLSSDKALAATPRIDAVLEGDRLFVTAEVPGVKPEEMEISIHQGVLELRGNWPAAPEIAGSGIRERARGAFHRRLRLPFEVDVENVTARFEHGVVLLELAKAESAKPRRIPVLAN